MTKLKATKTQAFTLSPADTFLKKTQEQEERGCQINAPLPSRLRVSNLSIFFLNLFISLTALKTWLNNLFISDLNLFISLTKEHQKENTRNFERDKITYSKF